VPAKKPEYIKHIVCNTLSKLEKALICRLGWSMKPNKCVGLRCRLTQPRMFNTNELSSHYCWGW